MDTLYNKITRMSSDIKSEAQSVTIPMTYSHLDGKVPRKYEWKHPAVTDCDMAINIMNLRIWPQHLWCKFDPSMIPPDSQTHEDPRPISRYPSMAQSLFPIQCLGEAQAALGTKEGIGPESFKLLRLIDINSRSCWATRQWTFSFQMGWKWGPKLWANLM